VTANHAEIYNCDDSDKGTTATYLAPNLSVGLLTSFSADLDDFHELMRDKEYVLPLPLPRSYSSVAELLFTQDNCWLTDFRQWLKCKIRGGGTLHSGLDP